MTPASLASVIFAPGLRRSCRCRRGRRTDSSRCPGRSAACRPPGRARRTVCRQRVALGGDRRAILRDRVTLHDQLFPLLGQLARLLGDGQLRLGARELGFGLRTSASRASLSAARRAASLAASSSRVRPHARSASADDEIAPRGVADRLRVLRGFASPSATVAALIGLGADVAGMQAIDQVDRGFGLLDRHRFVLSSYLSPAIDVTPAIGPGRKSRKIQRDPGYFLVSFAADDAMTSSKGRPTR